MTPLLIAALALAWTSYRDTTFRRRVRWHQQHGTRHPWLTTYREG